MGRVRPSYSTQRHRRLRLVQGDGSPREHGLLGQAHGDTLMPVFHSGHFRVFWNVLMDAAFRSDQVGDDSEVTIVSPWISDVMTSESGWSDSALSSAFGTHGGNIESLSDVLGNLVSLGYKVTVVTLSTTGKWLPKSRNAHHDNERRFLEKVSRRGVSVPRQERRPHEVHRDPLLPDGRLDQHLIQRTLGEEPRVGEPLLQGGPGAGLPPEEGEDFSGARGSKGLLLVKGAHHRLGPPQFHASPGAAAPDLSAQPDLPFPAVSDEEYYPEWPHRTSPRSAPLRWGAGRR